MLFNFLKTHKDYHQLWNYEHFSLAFDFTINMTEAMQVVFCARF